jgi:Trk-type K+ transport system membrane component
MKPAVRSKTEVCCDMTRIERVKRKRCEASRMLELLTAAALMALVGFRDGFDPVRQAICHTVECCQS